VSQGLWAAQTKVDLPDRPTLKATIREGYVMRRPCLAAVGAVCLSACGTDPDDFGRCTGDVNITVSSAMQPDIAWTPSGCLVNEVAVDGPSGPLWALYNPEPVNRIESPVRYGQPASAGESQSPGPGAGGADPDTGHTLRGEPAAH
jgi:hypothetical protein